MITISLSPNTERDDVLLALKLLCMPWKWQYGEALNALTAWFGKKFTTPHVFLYNSGRSALFEILKAYGIGRGDEVILQAFTCVAVPNSVLWNGATPVYVDIDKSYNINPWKLESLITKRTKAIIVQHTFGIPAEIDKIVTLAKKHHVVVIEDCAHALGASYKGKLLGTWGEAAIFSFGRDKVLSSVFGGVGIVRKDQKSIAQKMAETVLPKSRLWWVFQQLLHPLAFSVILPSYDLYVGKILLVLMQKFQLLSFPVYPQEKKGKQPADFPAQFPNCLAALAFNQVRKLDRYNQNRREIADLYRQAFQKKSGFVIPPHRNGAIYLRFPLLHQENVTYLSRAKQKGILLGNWYHNRIDPTGTDFPAVGFVPEGCQVADSAASTIINLPTRISKEQADKVISVLQ